MKQSKFGVFDIILAVMFVAMIGQNVYAHGLRADAIEAEQNPGSAASQTSTPQTTPPQTPVPEAVLSIRPEETPAPTPGAAALWGGHFSDAQWRKALQTDWAPYLQQHNDMWATTTKTGGRPLYIKDVDLTGVWIMCCGIAHSDSHDDSSIVDVTIKYTISKTGAGYVSDVELLSVMLREEGAYADHFLSQFSPKAVITSDNNAMNFFTFEDSGGVIAFLLFDLGGVSLVGTDTGNEENTDGAFFLSFWRIGD